MVGTAAGLPSVQMHGPAGLRGDFQSDIALHELGSEDPHAGRGLGGCRGYREHEGRRPGLAHS